MLLLEALLKFGSVGVMLALAIIILRDTKNVPALRFSVPLVVTLTCMLLTTGSPELRIDGPAAVPLRLIDTFSSLFIWWLCLALFDDEFELNVKHWMFAAVFAAIGIPVKLYYLAQNHAWLPALDHHFFAIVDNVFALITLCLMAHLIYRALSGRQEDLLETRRQVRVWFSISIALVLVLSITAERIAINIGIESPPTIWITYLFTFPITIWATLWLTQFRPKALTFEPPAEGSLTINGINPRDTAAHDKLVDFIDEQRGYARHGLTIVTLADAIGIPAHQLRSLINRSMGYQNFSAFLNGYRIRDVKSAMRKPENARTPILTLAMDAGYRSLAPFNRAFKRETGMTPSEYRAKLLDEMSTKAVQK